MADPRIEKFAKTICKSLDIVEDDIVLITGTEVSANLILELQKEILKRSAYPLIRISLEQMRYNFYKYAHEKHLTQFPPGLAKEIEIATKVISIESATNPNQINKIDQNRINQWKQTAGPYYRKLDFVPTVVSIFPNLRYADQAGMNLEEYEKLFYDAVSIDLEKLYEDYHPIEEMLSNGNHFEIKTSNTNLVFDLGDRNFTLHSLLINFPDGELFCSPIESSVNGYIRFEQPQSYSGKIFQNLAIEFRNGEVTQVCSETNMDALQKLLKTDSGAKRLGEFGFGINPALKNLTNDILFDEKVTGTIHIALGDAYVEVGGTNRSLIHFDMVKDMRGDGVILVDGRVVYRDGKFVI